MERDRTGDRCRSTHATLNLLNPSRTKSVARAASGVFAGVLIYLAAEIAIFGSGWYFRFLEPGTSLAGAVKMCIDAEVHRAASAEPVVAVIGNSMLGEGFSAKVADREAAGRMRFANLAVAATSPRCWYYELRAADPNANRYRAIVLQIELFSDEDGDFPMADQIGDLHAVDTLLRPSDAFAFAFSFRRPRLKFEALRGALLKGYVLKHDVQDLLEHPVTRVERMDLFKRGYAGWVYDYTGHPESLAGLTVDWERRTMYVPPNVPAAVAARLRRIAFRQRSPDTGLQTQYRRLWFGRIIDRYRETGTRVIFARVPRGPVVAPDSDPPGERSVVRDLALPRDTFTALERPENFWDEYHMNARGRELFSRQLAQELAR
jgi:hypothetical protein